MHNNFAKAPASSKPIFGMISESVAIQPQAQMQLRHRLLANVGPVVAARHTPVIAEGSKRTHRSGKSVNSHNDVAALYEDARNALSEGNVNLALDFARRACAAPAARGECYRLYAELLWRSGKLEDAIATARTMVRHNRKNARAWDLLARLLAEQKAFSESRVCYEKAVALDRTLLEAMQNLATVLQRLGHVTEAEAKYREALMRAPDHLETHLNLACLLNEVGRTSESLTIVEAVIASDPGLAKAYVVASAIEYKAERYPSALRWIEQAISLAPDQIKLLTRRADILSKLGNNEQALSDCEKVLGEFPDDIEATRSKACVLQDIGRPEDALTTLLRGEAATSDNAGLAVDRAWTLAEMGRKSEALQLLDTVISARPDFVLALDCRAFLGQHKSDHSDINVMEKIVAKPETPIKDRMRLSFSIGRAYIDAGDGDKAFHYLNYGNGLKRKSVTYNRLGEERWFAGIMQVFSDDHMQHFARSSIRSNRPIFVFGVPRSGTTLVEQILASHPLVRGTGESPYLNTLARSTVFSPGLIGFSQQHLTACADQYLSLAGAGVPKTLQFVDKTNSNFLYAGLISLMLPGARMIHCRRDPLDTCLSAYSLMFAHGNEFSYDLAELGHYYGLYRKIMTQWDSVLPAGTMLDIEYETLVNDTEAQVRENPDFCGLPWYESCLRFYETNRVVTTSSLNQVRSPIYHSSVGRAQKFRPWLGSLIQALNREAAACF